MPLYVLGLDILIGLETILDPTEYTSGGVLGKGCSPFPQLSWSVRVRDA